MVLDTIKSGVKLGGKLFVAAIVLLLLLAVLALVVGTLLFGGADPSASPSTQLESYRVTMSNESAVVVAGRLYNPSAEPERVRVNCTMDTERGTYTGFSGGSVGAGYEKDFVVVITGISADTTVLDKRSQTSCSVTRYQAASS